MDIKYVFFLMPLTWAILIYIINGTFGSTFAVTIVVSFIASGLITAGLSGFHVIGSGLNDSATWILFILLFGAMFYGVTVAGVSFGETDSHLINGNILHYHKYVDFVNDGWNINDIPPYIKTVQIDLGYPSVGNVLGYPVIIENPVYDSTAPTNNTQLGFGVTGSTGLGNSMFTDMPYFGFVNLIFGVMYAFGLYMNITAKKE